MVNVLPVVTRLAVPGFCIDAHVVAKQAVEADVFETDFVLAQLQLLLPVGAETLGGAASADALAKHFRVRPFHRLPVRRYDPDGLWRVSSSAGASRNTRQPGNHGGENQNRELNGRIHVEIEDKAKPTCLRVNQSLPSAKR
jgi:hypothetical protein